MSELTIEESYRDDIETLKNQIVELKDDIADYDENYTHNDDIEHVDEELEDFLKFCVEIDSYGTDTQKAAFIERLANVNTVYNLPTKQLDLV